MRIEGLSLIGAPNSLETKQDRDLWPKDAFLKKKPVLGQSLTENHRKPWWSESLKQGLPIIENDIRAIANHPLLHKLKLLAQKSFTKIIER